MEIRTVQYFLAVAAHGSLSAAAQASFVTQPSLSRQMAELERELGVTLFRRTASGLKLNQAGERFYPIARDIAQRLDRGVNVMRSLAAGSLSLVVACPPTVMDNAIAPFIAATGAPISDIREFAPDSVYPQLEHGVDLAIGVTEPSPHLCSRALASVEVHAQAGPGALPVGSDGTVDIRDLLDRDLLVIKRGSSARRALDDAAVTLGTPLRYTDEVSSSTVAQALAAAGRGVAIVAAAERFGLSSAPLSARSERLTFIEWAAWDGQHYAASEIASMVEALAAWFHPHSSQFHSTVLE